MNSDQKKKNEQHLKDAGYTQSAYDSTKWSNGSTNIRVDSTNGYNDNGTKYRGYDNCKDHLKGKK
jgi:hypothetical protein